MEYKIPLLLVEYSTHVDCFVSVQTLVPVGLFITICDLSYCKYTMELHIFPDSHG